MTTIDSPAPTTVKLPPGPPCPRSVQGALAVAHRRIGLQMMRRRYGSAFTIELPIFGQMVVLSDPSHIRQLFRTAPGIVDTTDANLGRVMGSNSMFALMGDRHRTRRKLLTPSFNGRRLAAYEAIIEREEFERLRQILPPGINLGSMLSLVPVPQWDWGQWSPWGRFRQYRREYDTVV